MTVKVPSPDPNLRTLSGVHLDHREGTGRVFFLKEKYLPPFAYTFFFRV